jgi:hypothetical protein
LIEIDDSDVVVGEVEVTSNVESEQAGGVRVSIGKILTLGVEDESPAEETGSNELIDIEDSEVLEELEETFDNVEHEQQEEEESDWMAEFDDVG